MAGPAAPPAQPQGLLVALPQTVAARLWPGAQTLASAHARRAVPAGALPPAPLPLAPACRRLQCCLLPLVSCKCRQQRAGAQCAWHAHESARWEQEELHSPAPPQEKQHGNTTQGRSQCAGTHGRSQEVICPAVQPSSTTTAALQPSAPTTSGTSDCCGGLLEPHTTHLVGAPRF